MQAGDVITSINNQAVDTLDTVLIELDSVTADSMIDLTVVRGVDESHDLSIPAVKIETDDEYGIGAYLTETGTVKLPFLSAISVATNKTFALIKTIFIVLGSIIAGLFNGSDATSNLSGPLGIASLTHEATQLGFIYVLQFTAILSINLAIFNLLPFPALDGGRIIFLLFELIIRRPVNQKVEAVIHNLGFILLLVLLLAVTIKDVFTVF